MTAPIAKTGIGVGALAILGSLGAFFAFFADPTNLLHAYDGVKYHQDPSGVWEHAAGLTVAVVGSIVLTVLSAYLHPSPAQPEKASP